MIFIVFICGFLAFALSTICGGGAGLMLIPLLGGVVSVSQIPAALSIGTLTSSASRIALFYKRINWHIVKWFVPMALPAVWLGAWMLKFINPVYLELIMGVFLISNLPLVFKKKDKDANLSALPNYALLIIGGLAGFISGITGAVGLLFNRFYLRYGLTKEEIVATRAANEVLLHLVKIILYAMFGLITSDVSMVGLSIAASAIFASWSMKYILPKLSDALFKRIGYGAMVLAGFLMLGKATGNIAETNNMEVSEWNYKQKGVQGNIMWNGNNFAFEWSYDEGFILEQAVPLSELSENRQTYINSLAEKLESDKIEVEIVYSMWHRSTYEVYFFKDDELIHKQDIR